MDSISFNSKILLFGEYGIMHDSNALSIPYKKFNGSLSKSNHLSEDQKISNRNIESLYEYIIQEDYLNDIINSDNLKEEIDSGLYFFSLPKFLFGFAPIINSSSPPFKISL